MPAVVGIGDREEGLQSKRGSARGSADGSAGTRPWVDGCPVGLLLPICR